MSHYTVVLMLSFFLVACSSSQDSDPTQSAFDNAIPLELQDAITGTVLSSSEETKHVYRLNVDPYQNYSIDFFVENSATSLPGNIRVSTRNGTQLLTKRMVSNLLTDYFEFSSENNAEVFVEIWIEYPSIIQFQYQLSIYPPADAGLLRDPVTFEPNNTNSTARLTVLQETVSNYLAAGTLGHKDVYSVEVVAGKTYTIMTTFSSGTPTGAGTDLLLEVTDEQGRLLQNESRIAYGQTGYFEITPIDTGRMYITLQSTWQAQNRYYGYDLVVLPATASGLFQDNITFEPNNTASTAYPISLDIPYQSELVEGTADHFDFYSINLNANTSYSVEILNNTATRTGAYTELYLFITDTDGRTLMDEKHISSQANSTFGFTTPLSSTGIIKIYSHPMRYDENFQYNLQVISP